MCTVQLFIYLSLFPQSLFTLFCGEPVPPSLLFNLFSSASTSIYVNTVQLSIYLSLFPRFSSASIYMCTVQLFIYLSLFPQSLFTLFCGEPVPPSLLFNLFSSASTSIYVNTVQLSIYLSLFPRFSSASIYMCTVQLSIYLSLFPRFSSASIYVCTVQLSIYLSLFSQSLSLYLPIVAPSAIASQASWHGRPVPSALLCNIFFLERSNKVPSKFGNCLIQIPGTYRSHLLIHLPQI